MISVMVKLQNNDIVDRWGTWISKTFIDSMNSIVNYQDAKISINGVYIVNKKNNKITIDFTSVPQDYIEDVRVYLFAISVREQVRLKEAYK